MLVEQLKQAGRFLAFGLGVCVAPLFAQSGGEQRAL